MAGFLDKWSAKKAEKPKAGQKSTLDTFKGKIKEQQDLLAEYEGNKPAFKKWRSTWFQPVAGGFGISVGRDALDAGSGVNYVKVGTTAEVKEFLDDLRQHAETDKAFQETLEGNRQRRAALLASAKAGVGGKPSKAKK
jgi:hypothetical protein